MTLALKKIASVLGTLVVLGMMMFASSPAQAHVARDSKAVEHSAPFRAFAADFVDLHRSAIEAERIEALPDVSVSGDHSEDPHPTAETSCCGNGVSACWSGALAEMPSALPRPVSGGAVSAFSHTALLGLTVDGLIRPPRASV